VSSVADLTLPLTRRLTRPLTFPLDARGDLGTGGGYNPVSALGADLLAYWDADRTDLMTRDGSNLISSWRDVKAGADLTQPTTTLQPVWSATSFNGSPGVTPDALDDFLQLAPHPFWTGATAGEIWAVCAQDALPADATVRTLVAVGPGSANGRVISRVVVTLANRLRVQSGDGTSAQVRTGSTGDFSARHVVRHIVSATDQAGEIDGTSDPTSGAVVSSSNNTRMRLFAFTNTGATLFWQGKIRKLLFTNALTAEKASALRIWLLTERKL
jgi:hypothetical protein